MEPNIEAINEQIDAMANVIAKEIRAVVGKIIGKPLIEPVPPLRTAQVWRNDKGCELAIFRQWTADNWISLWTPNDGYNRIDGAAEMYASGCYCGNEATLSQHLQLHGFKLIGTAELTVKPL